MGDIFLILVIKMWTKNEKVCIKPEESQILSFYNSAVNELFSVSMMKVIP